MLTIADQCKFLVVVDHMITIHKDIFYYLKLYQFQRFVTGQIMNYGV